MIVKLNTELVDQLFIEQVRKDNDFFLIFDEKFKENIIKYVRPESFIVPYGGTRQYSTQYNFADRNFNFDFDQVV